MRVHPDKARRIHQAIQNTYQPACACLRLHEAAFKAPKEKPAGRPVESKVIRLIIGDAFNE